MMVKKMFMWKRYKFFGVFKGVNFKRIELDFFYGVWNY